MPDRHGSPRLSRHPAPNALREWRKSAGMSRRQMADALNQTPTGQRDRLNCGQECIARWEDGHSRWPRRSHRQALAELTGHTVEELGFSRSKPDPGAAGTTLAQVQEQHPQWCCWRGLRSGIYYAVSTTYTSRRGYQLRAETVAGLSDQIRRAPAGAQNLPVIAFAAAATSRSEGTARA
jgi:transcriptional regulator with XRE-family HTH domain